MKLISHKQQTNMKKILVIATTFILLNSCKKDRTITFSGKIIRKLIECGSGNGYPYVIELNTGNKPDSAATVTLPEQYKIPGTRIRFKMREVKSGDTYMLCSGNIVGPQQVIVFDVSPD